MHFEVSVAGEEIRQEAEANLEGDQLAGEGEALRMARSTAMQVAKYDPVARAATKEFMKPIPREELESEIDIFCELFARPEVMAALKKFVEDSGPMPYLP